VFSIREAAIETLTKLTQQFGSDWARDNLVPAILATLENRNYLYRTTGLHTIAALAPYMHKNVVESQLVPAIVHSAQNDRIPNVRFNSAKVLQNLVPSTDKSLLNKVIKPCLMQLKDDDDSDVRYFAIKALVACEVIS
jgi:serine/threonine-protein phosphatase 2A regulatory subunit A